MGDQDKRIEELFQLGVVVPRAEREAFLRRHCGDDAALRAELEALLAQDDEGTKGYLESPLLTKWRHNDTSRQSDPAATPEVLRGSRTERIGRYEVLHELGEGGMGAVYLAQQSEPVRREVALKVVKLGMDTRRVVARFDRERQALALMDHPGIARIFDGGTTETGRPYFVMEYVPGAPITDFCDAHQLDVRQRLELFIQVCEAVQHAHSKGIIHRDLKPTNVLVAERDGRPTAKVIDFGIARAVENAGFQSDESADTRSHEVVGTYAYMSPEQADPEVEEIDARADVYALGVMLYELLTGALPIDQSALRGRSPSEISRILADTDPAPPSTRITRLGASSGRVAERRGGMNPRELVRCTSGDLDWITLRAMEQDPARRYPTAAALASDVRRHLRDEAVLAGPPSRVYRARKFVRRHRIGVAATAALVLTITSGATGTFLGFSEASEEARAARAAEQDALVAANTAREALALEAESRESLEAYNEVLLDLVDLSDPETPLRSDEFAVSLLTDLRRQIADVFQDDPRGEATVRVRVGRAMRMRGELELAREDLLRARALQEQHDAPLVERLETRREIHELLVDTGGFADFSAGLEAAQLEVELLTELDEGVGDAAETLLKATTDHDVDDVLKSLGAVQGALAGITGDERHQAGVVVADLCGLTGGYLGLHLAFGEGEPLLTAAVTLREELLGATHPEVVAALDELVLHLNLQGRSHDAVAVLAARVEAFHQRFAPGHWLRGVVDSLHGESLSLVGRRAEALPLLASAHGAILQDRGPRSRVAVHAALRLREHYARDVEAAVPEELNAALDSSLALARDRGAAWLRTAETLGAGAEVTEALSTLFATNAPSVGPKPAATHAVEVLSTLMARAGAEPRLGDLVSRAIVLTEETRLAGDPAPSIGWGDALHVAQQRVDAQARQAEELPRPQRREAPLALPLAPPALAPAAPSSEPATTVATLPTEPVAAVTEVESVDEAPQDPAEELEWSADELIMFAWLASAEHHGDLEIYGLALEASEVAMELAPQKPEYVVVQALALARIGAWQPALDVLQDFEDSVGQIGFIGWCARALAYDQSGQVKLAVGSFFTAAIEGLLHPWTMPPKSLELLLELERRVLD